MLEFLQATPKREFIMLEPSQQHCPYCGEAITLLVDESAGDSTYIEDCEGCCQPISVQLTLQGDGFYLRLSHENEV